MKIKTVILAALASTALVATSASAVSILKFDDPDGPGGTISYDGAGGAAVGTNIWFQTVQGIFTPLNAGGANELTCDSNCLLNFSTGANISEPGTGWSWAGGGSFTLTGTLRDSANTIIATGTLLTGSFTGAGLTLPSAGVGGGLLTFSGFGIDTKADGIETYFGLPVDTEWRFASTEIGIAGGCINNTTKAFNCSVINSDINNIQSVPEPMALGMLGLGLLGLGLSRRRKV